MDLKACRQKSQAGKVCNVQEWISTFNQHPIPNILGFGSGQLLGIAAKSNLSKMWVPTEADMDKNPESRHSN